ncbi:MAG: EAL domain-containing protein, partial [Gloeocapsa sp. DLM2.Bin57]
NPETYAKTTLPSQEYLSNFQEISQEDLLRLASFPELSPNPIIEVNYQGEITYINSAARFQLKNIKKILDGLIKETQSKQGGLIRKEIQVENRYYDQYIHYLAEKKLIRVYLFDVTERRQTEEALQASEARYRAVVRQVAEGICLVDVATGKIIEANSAYCQLLGYDLTQIQLINFVDIIEYPQTFSEKLQEVINNNLDFWGEVIHRRQDGCLIEVEMSISLIYYQNQQIFCCTVRDITQRKRNEQLLAYQAFHDDLTGLANRKFFEVQLNSILSNAQTNNSSIAVMFLDIDHFKNINDTLGHTIGDELLKAFAERLKSCVRSNDIISRWGGDEFTILISNINQREDVINLAQRILKSLEQPFNLSKHLLYVKSSIGIALYPEDGEDGENLVKNADIALYRAKNEGRNNYRCYTSIMSSEISALLALENQIAQALNNQQLSLYYQPRVNIKTNSITAIEAEVLWQHPEQGLVSLQPFLPHLEETEQIIPLRDWLIETACKQSQQWQLRGLPLIPVSLSLSSRQLRQSNLVEKVQEILQQTKLAANLLELEVNEQILLKDIDMSSEILNKLIEIGIRICVDDFGTSYHFIRYLRKFLFHTLKIDQSLIQELPDNPQESGIIAAMITLGNSFNMNVVAQGIEKPEQLAILRQLDCQEMQGNLFSHPLSIIEVTDLLVKGLELTKQ